VTPSAFGAVRLMTKLILVAAETWRSRGPFALKYGLNSPRLRRSIDDVGRTGVHQAPGPTTKHG